MPSTKIVCTIGPASRSKEVLEQLILAGMNVARLNFSHGTHEEHAEVIARIRALSTEIRQPVAILQDLQGPKIRTGELREHQPVTLSVGAAFILTTRPIIGDASQVSTTYQNLPQDVKPGDHILLADGLLELEVTDTSPTDVYCRVLHGGALGEHKGINLPGVAVSAAALTEKDKDDLRFGVSQGVDFVALSFVRAPADLQAARDIIAEMNGAASSKQPDSGGHTTTRERAKGPPLIAKLERPEAIAHLDAILEAADGVMVARGDLGVELAPEKVPLIQKQIITRANEYGIPVITATQMLESMVSQPRPTRAETSDVANAILDGTDAVMLSEETASGHYPVEAVRMMVRIAQTTEPACKLAPRTLRHSRPTLGHAVSKAAHLLAQEAAAQAIVVFTRSGRTGYLISKERPHVPIIAYTPFEQVYRQLVLWWGITPHLIPLMTNFEEMIAQVSTQIAAEGLVPQGEKVVIIGGMPVSGSARTNFIKLHQI
ncbi:MAG TPA: pyruvate kinase [Ktedonobacterales bacterium]|nr:pyruvate kinase [Ktedonobacterales bacterium]